MRHYFFCSADARHPPQELHLPVRVGGSKHAGIVIPGVAEDQLVAMIALDNGHAYIQPASIAFSIFHNDERLTDSAWLKSGDRVQIANQVLSWEVQGDRVMISVQPHQPDSHELRPPKHPRKTNPPAGDTLPVAENNPLSHKGKRLRWSIISLIGFLLLAASYLLTATSVDIRVEPVDAKVKISWFPPSVSLGDAHLMFPGNYQLDITSEGYSPYSSELEIKMGPSVDFAYSLTELPGLISLNLLSSHQISSHQSGTNPTNFNQTSTNLAGNNQGSTDQSSANPAQTSLTRIDTSQLAELTLYVDEIEVPATTHGKYEIERGDHSIRIESLRYLPQSLDIDVDGFGAEQSFDIELIPAWAMVNISSTPDNADILIDGIETAHTPALIEVLQGQRQIRIEKPGFKPVTLFQAVIAGQDFDIGAIELEPVNGEITINTNPPGASILVGDQFLGTTPQTLSLASETDHKLSLSKNGYITSIQSFRLAPEEQRSMNIKLEAEFGVVFINVKPAGTSLSINGQKSASASGRLRLQTRENTLLFSKAGYISQQISLTPRPDVSQNISVELITEKRKQAQVKEAATPGLLKSPGGQTLELIKPESNLEMGASRSGAGRRANESRRLVKLQRPFYLSHKEVTNKEFEQFDDKHDSGSMDIAALNGDNQPVVNVSWDDAARYCNWLSKQQGLPEAYREENGQMQAVNPMNTGYRLPTEAEWAWVARRYGFESNQRYPWVGNFPPSTLSGNYADAQIADTLTDVVPNYDDGFRGTAAVGSFPAWPESVHGGFYDLGGNAAEWIHDFYAVYPGEATRLVTDPMGPVTGNHHVVRGASWRDGNITELRLSYRDYSNKPGYDLGFRIARYAE